MREGMELAGRARRVGTALALAALVCVLAPAAARAVIVPLQNGRTISYQPVTRAVGGSGVTDGVFHNLDYSGGPVMASNTDYTFYWDPSGGGAYPSDYRPAIDGFFEDLAHDSGGRQNVDSVATQYNDTSGALAAYDVRFGGEVLDTDGYPASGCEVAPTCLTDGQIRAELVSYLKSHGLPLDLTHAYFVLLPPGVETCFGPGNASCSAGTVSHEREAFCAYHGAEQLSGGAVVIYAQDPYVFGGRCDDGNHPNGTTADATISAGLSHEHVETVTDPIPNSAWTDWATGGSTGFEIGDKCRTLSQESEFGTPLGTAPDGALYNQVLDGHEYWYQQEWSNAGHACIQRLAPLGTLPRAAFTFQAGETTATFDASASTAPGGVAEYDWEPGEYEGEPPQETTSPLFEWSDAVGILHVGLTVFAADGTSAGTMHVVNVGHVDEPAITKVSPTKGPVTGGTAVTITGKNLIEDETTVRFGARPATSFKTANGTSLVAIAPPSPAGAVDVTVATYFGTSPITSSDRFRFQPVVSAVKPNHGPLTGGTVVTVTGTGFLAGSTGTVLKVGGHLARKINCATTTSCKMTTPLASTVGTVDVTATVAKVTSAKTSADRFTYE